MKKYIVFLCCVLICNVVKTQNLTFYGFLPSINQTGKLTKKLKYNLFISTTIDAFGVRINSIEYPATDLQFYVQPSIIYLCSQKINFSGSITYQRNNPFNNNFINEYRIWQQIIYAQPISKAKLTNRIRFEERFIENKTTKQYPFSTRLRYQLGFNVPLKGHTLDKHEFYFNTYNELYFSLTGVKNATYSENWSYAGCGYDLGKIGKIEIGYLLQVAVRNKQQNLRFLNLLPITWITNFGFNKNKKE